MYVNKHDILFIFPRIMFSINVTTGGIVGYTSRSNRGLPYNATYPINGMHILSPVFELEIDFLRPEHCLESNSTCLEDPLRTTTDFLTEVGLLHETTCKLLKCNTIRTYTIHC